MIALRLAEESAYASAEIGIGAQDRLTWVPVDDEITRWLNTIDDSDESLPPVPNPDAWHWFRMPSAGPRSTCWRSFHTQTDSIMRACLLAPKFTLCVGRKLTKAARLSHWGRAVSKFR